MLDCDTDNEGKSSKPAQTRIDCALQSIWAEASISEKVLSVFRMDECE